MTRDPFTWAYEQRERMTPDLWQYSGALLFVGIGISFTESGTVWTMVSLACLLAGGSLLGLAMRRSRQRP